MTLTCGSLFDGIGAISAGVQAAGFTLKWTVEIDEKCRRVTAARFPGVRQYEDVRHVGKDDLEPVDLVVGGSPCQGYSTAGRRAGMADERSGLFGQMARIVDELRPRWVVWENVPGCFTTNGGRDFAAVLGAFSGYEPGFPAKGWLDAGFCVGPERACAWAVLDGQHFGVPQRRKRVFVVCRSGNPGGLDLTQPGEECGRLRGLPWQVLSVAEGVQRHLDARGQKGKGAARAAAAGPRGGGGDVAYACHGGNVGPAGTFRSGNGGVTDGVPFLPAVAPCLRGNAHNNSDAGMEAQMLVECVTGGVTHALMGVGHDGSEDGTGRGTPIVTQPASVVPAVYGGNDTRGQRAAAACLSAKGGTGRLDFESENFVVGPTFAIQDCRDIQKDQGGLGVAESSVSYTLDSMGQQGVAHATAFAQNQRDEVRDLGDLAGALAAQPGMKQQTYVTTAVAIPFDTTQITSPLNYSSPQEGDPSPSLGGSHTPAIAFHATQDPINGPTAPCLGTTGSGSIGVLTFQERGREGGRSIEISEGVSYALTSPQGGGRSHERNILAPAYGIGPDAIDRTGEGASGTAADRAGLNVSEEVQPALRARPNNSVASGLTTRRLTPTECCRLMGLTDWWLDVDPPLSDSTKYKMLGNAAITHCLTWIGLGVLAAEHGWLGDPDFMTMREMACRGDELSQDAIADWIEERTGSRPWRQKDAAP